MEIATVTLELAKEAAAETIKETAKATETMNEFGKVGNTLATEHINLGKIGTGNCGEHISFGSLANGEFKRNANYINWKDGIAADELTIEWMQELTDEISKIYGTEWLSVGELKGFNNAGISPQLNMLEYDPEYIRSKANKYGRDCVLGTLAHEVGHEIVSTLGFDANSRLFDVKWVDKLARGMGVDTITPYADEVCADYIAGLTARLCNLDPTHNLSWYLDRSPITLDKVHPGSSVRAEAFKRGYTRIDRGEEAVSLKAFEKFAPYDWNKIYQDKSLLRKILEEDVLEPLRNGEIVKI